MDPYHACTQGGGGHGTTAFFVLVSGIFLVFFYEFQPILEGIV